jgi:hypothetical protein
VLRLELVAWASQGEVSGKGMLNAGDKIPGTAAATALGTTAQLPMNPDKMAIAA